MKSLSGAYTTHVALNSTTLCSIILIERKDSTTYAFTDHDSEVTVDAVVYKPSNSFIPTDFQTSATLSVDNLDVTGIVSEIDDITEEDIYREFFYDAKIWVSIVNYNDPDNGRNKILYGSLGEMTLQENTYTVEFRNLTYILTRNLANVFSKTCRVELGSTECGVLLDPSDWAATTLYCVGDKVSALSYDGRIYEATTAGISNASVPTFNTTVGGTTVETSGLTWTTRDGYSKVGKITTGTKIRLEIDKLAATQGTNSGIEEISFFDETDTRIYPSSCVDNTAGDCTDLYDGTSASWEAVSPQNNIYVEFTFSSGFSWKSFTMLLDTYSYIDSFKFRISFDGGTNWKTVYSKFGLSSEYWFDLSYSLSSTDIYITGSKVLPNVDLFSDMNYIQDGVLTWTSGDNIDKSIEVRYYDTTNKVMYLFQPMPYNIKFTDTYTITSGCNHLYLGSDGTTATGHCISRYANGINFRGEPHVPTEDVLVGGIGETNKQPYSG